MGLKGFSTQIATLPVINNRTDEGLGAASLLQHPHCDTHTEVLDSVAHREPMMSMTSMYAMREFGSSGLNGPQSAFESPTVPLQREGSLFDCPRAARPANFQEGNSFVTVQDQYLTTLMRHSLRIS